MEVKLVSITKSLIEERELSAEELIVYIARVSNPSNQLNSETSDNLISYLVSHKHWSPFEMVDMTVEIVTSRGIAQQIIRHRSFSFQEFSQRYSEVSHFEDIELRKSGAKNRQSSTEVFDPLIKIQGKQARLINKASLAIAEHFENCENLYKALLNSGVAKECARFVLPISTQTKIYMKGSVRSWIHYLQIRNDDNTQIEHRNIALLVTDIFKKKFPKISKSLNL